MLNATQGFTYNKFEKPNDWPKIDKTFDYKIENGKLLSGNEHIYLSGPVTYTKVGSPTLVDNVASGFSDSDYLHILSAPDVSKPFEVFLKITIGTSEALQYVVRFTGTNSVFAINAGPNHRPSFLMRYYGTDGSLHTCDTYSSTVAFADNTSYYVRCLCDANGISLSYSTDNTNWTTRTTPIPADFVSWQQPTGVYLSDTSVPFNGSIDLNETYIKVNDHLWFYGKNYTTKNMVPVPAGLEYNNTTTPSIGWVNTNTDRVKGSVNYAVVGSITISDGVASGFSASDYLTSSISTPNNFNSISGYIKFQTGSSFSNENLAMLVFYHLRIGWTSAGRPGIRYYDDGTEKTSYFSNFLSTNKEYTINFNITATTIDIALYDGNTLVESNTYSGNFELPFNRTLDLGRAGSAAYLQYTSIDLNSTYIKINGQAWFGNCPSEFQQFTAAPQGTMIGKDDTHTLNVVSKNNIGTVGYTVHGSPTIVDNVVSGFSGSDYITTRDLLDWNENVEWVVKVETPSTYASLNQIVYMAPMFLYVTSTGGLSLMYTSNGNVKYLNAVSSLQTSTTYYIKIVKDTASFSLYLSSDGITYDLQQTRTDFLPTTTSYVSYGVNGSSTYTPWPGSIDLNETYIKVNDQVWFGTLPAEPKLVGPVNYTVVGNPTIENGMVSGFSSSDYLSISNFRPGNASWLLVTSFITPATVDNIYRGIISKQGAMCLNAQHTGAQGIEVAFSSNGTNLDIGYIRSDYIFNDNTKYWLKIEFTGSQYNVSTSSDGLSYTSVGSIQRSTAINDNSNPLNIGVSRVLTAYSNSIDLNQTYIKVNGSLWFGKEDWTPSTYTDNAIYLLGSHKADYSNYNQLSLTPSIETESDEVGSYNVWIDNQKIIENKTGNTLLEWDKLALTTGYSITTPSALKAHPIKIEPTNSTDSIIAFNTETIEESDESI